MPSPSSELASTAGRFRAGHRHAPRDSPVSDGGLHTRARPKIRPRPRRCMHMPAASTMVMALAGIAMMTHAGTPPEAPTEARPCLAMSWSHPPRKATLTPAPIAGSETADWGVGASAKSSTRGSAPTRRGRSRVGPDRQGSGMWRAGVYRAAIPLGTPLTCGFTVWTRWVRSVKFELSADQLRTSRRPPPLVRSGSRVSAYTLWE